MPTQPLVVVLGGPNGAGNSTAASRLLPAELTFINANEVAKRLPKYPLTATDLEAPRLVLEEDEIVVPDETAATEPIKAELISGTSRE